MALPKDTHRPVLSFVCILLLSSFQSTAGQLAFQSQATIFTLPEDVHNGTLITTGTLKGGDGLQVVSETTNVYVNVTNRGTQTLQFDVVLNTTLDYDYGPQVIQCSIRGSSNDGQSKYLDLKIFVTDVNDMTPVLQNQPYSVAVPEDTGQSTTVYTSISASDKDTIDSLHYNISTTGEDKFTISQDGSLILKGALDFETLRFYHYIVTVTDKVGHNSSADVFITVEDVQDTSPYFTGEPFQTKINENEQPGATLLTIRAADGDLGVSNNITLKIINGTCTSFFDIHPTSGKLKLKSGVDRDTGEVYQNNGICTFEIQATEDTTYPQVGGSDTAVTSVTVTILDVNDNGPAFSNTSYHVTVDENTQVGVPINLNTPITISDPDQGTNAQFEVLVIGLEDYFEVTPSQIQSSGDILIRVKNSTILDYETVQNLTLELEARDTSNISYTSRATVTIYINNVNDNSPVFSNSTFYATVPENSPSSAYVTTITATDADKADHIHDYETVHYTLQGSDSSFKINPSTGNVTVDIGQLDRETKSVYYLTVIAEDGGHIKTNALLEITISDKNDEKPSFITSDYQTSLKEGAMTFIPPITVHATDKDDPKSPNSQIFYSIISTQPKGLEQNFSLDSVSGTLTVKHALEFEQINFLPGDIGNITLIVEAKDKGSPAQSSIVSVAVNLQDINNKNPACGQQQYKAEIYENSTKSSSVYTVTATDADGTAPNKMFMFNIDQDSAGKFVINSSTGLLSLRDMLDREYQSHYDIIVTVTDFGVPALSGSCQVSVDVLDINDVPPEFLQKTKSATFHENALGLSVNMSAYDQDSDNKLVYKIIWEQSIALDQDGQSVNISILKNWAAIENDTGIVFNTEKMDREAIESFTLAIQVEDMHSATGPQVDNATLTVQVLDENDKKPEFSQRVYNGKIQENMPDDSEVSLHDLLIVTDEDKSDSSEFKLSITSPDNVFSVAPAEGKGQGQFSLIVKNTSVLDYEKHQVLICEIVATETKTKELFSNTATVSISIGNTNDNMPEFVNAPFSATVLENEPNGTLVTTITAHDADKDEFGTVTYTLLNNPQEFTINETSGEVFTNVMLNREQHEMYTVSVKATDIGNFASTTQLIITVTDVNDNNPQFPKNHISATVAENEDYFSKPLLVEATDADAPGNNSQIKYTLQSSIPANLTANFTIDPDSSEITLVSPLDYEMLDPKLNGVIYLTVKAEDQGVSHRSNTTSVTIYVTDMNDISPQFTMPTSIVNVPENMTTGKTVFNVTAIDHDIGTNNHDLSYLIDTLSGSIFNIDANSGEISLKTNLDYEKVQDYNITVTALDHGRPVQTSTAIINVKVTDVNDQNPQFLQKQSPTSVDENMDFQHNCTANDVDSSSKLEYSIQWDKSSGQDVHGAPVSTSELRKWFDIDAQTGSVASLKLLDREQVSVFVLQVHVEDTAAEDHKPQTDTATLTITVNDVNDQPPVFILGQYNASIQENMPDKSDIKFEDSQTLEVYDADDKESNNHFDVFLLTHNTTFSINPSSANAKQTFTISVLDSSMLDYEINKNFTLEVLAIDPNIPSLNSSATIFVNITNENDNIPEFIGGPYKTAVLENSAAFKTVITVNATDEDDGIYGEVTYSLEDPLHTFDINNISGEVYLLTGGIDRENVSEYTVKLIATDKGGFRATTQLIIEVSDVNDQSPIFTNVSYYLTFDEGITVLLPEYFVQAADKDEPKTLNSQIKYSLLDNTKSPQSNFSIDPDSGKLTLESPLDYESLHGPFNLTVQAEDLGAIHNLAKVSVEVTVRDINDNYPVFTPLTYGVSIYENITTGSSVVTVNATDNDSSSSNNIVSYSLDTLSLKTFSIHQNGTITVTGKLDREQTPDYTIIVTASDNGHPNLTSTASVTVTVLDVNDSPPTFSWDTMSVTKEENTNDVIAQNNATDPDTGSNLCYSILWSESNGMDGYGRFMPGKSLQALITINNSTGEVYPVNMLDREQLQRLQLTLVVEDKNNVPNTKNSDTAILTVIIEDEDDNSPTFNGNDFMATIQENMPPGSEIKMINVLALIITDADEGDNSMYNITLEDSSVFTISPFQGDGNTTCTITVANSSLLDYEQHQNFTIKVIATGHNTSRTESAVITVSISNINDNFPKFNQSSYEAYIPENATVGHLVTTLEASDADSDPFGSVQYSIDGVQTWFYIDNTTGQVFLNIIKIDREKKDSYAITVKARDSGGFEGSTQLTIRLTDCNDEIPTFEVTPYSAEIKEHDTSFRVPLIVKATDDDEPGTDNSKISYSITHVPAEFISSQLKINNITGEITLSSYAPDYENLTNVNQDRVLQLQVTATDWGSPPLNSSILVNVTVTDINDVEPKFGQSFYPGNVLENATTGDPIVTVTATDNDGTSPNNESYYVILSGSRDKLQINSTTGLISVGIGAQLDRETTDKNGFDLTVLAIDKGSPPMTGTTTVSIQVLDVNDVPPKISPVAGVFKVYENASIGHEIVRFTATDEDENHNLEFTVLFADSRAYDEKDRAANATLIKEWLDIDSVHGNVTVKSEMDREHVEQIILKVVVKDTNAITKYQEATATVTLSLLDVNDNAPEISSEESVLYLNVSEGTKVNTEVNTLTATDADKGQTVTFTLANADSFNITKSGTLKLTTSLDRENKNKLTFQVIATDSGSPPLSSNITVIVTVLDINDNDPVFGNKQTTFNVPEHSDNTTLVAKITASDQDDGDNANVTFEFKDVPPFRIDSITGQIYVSGELDRETTPSYTLTVIAMDNPLLESRRRASMAINIHIDDINDNDPVFQSSNYEGILSETALPGSPVTITPSSISATDKDFGNNSTITFSFIDSGLDFFRINASTGEVFVNQNITDRPGHQSYVVNASDHGDPVRWTEVNLTITILDANNNQPIFVNLTRTFQIPECASGGRSVYTFSATDADADKATNGKVQYYLDLGAGIGNNISQYFDLDRDAGILKIKNTASSGTLFDKEKLSELMMQVIAKDNGIPPNSVSSGPILIKITDINDNPPEFNPGINTNFTVQEGRSRVRVGNVKATDKDEGSQLEYELSDIDAPWKDYFDIMTDPHDGGVIYVNKPLDRERVSQIKLKVRANDISTAGDHQLCDQWLNTADSQSVPLDVTVFVDDINDNAPVFNERSLSVGFLSSTKFGERVINLQGHVKDNDTAANSVHRFYQVGEMQADSDISRTWTHDVKSDPIRIDLNGTISTNYKFSEDAYGFFKLQVLVNDSAGNDTIVLKIYVVGESQVIHITLWYTEDELRTFQADLTRELGHIGYQFVPDNILPAYSDDGSIDNSKSVLVTHAVDSEGNIISGKTVISALDSSPLAADVRNKFKMYKTESGDEAGKHAADTSAETIKYILIGIIAIVVITFVVTLGLLIHTIKRFKRKLTAATLEVNAIAPASPDIFPGLDNENIKSANPMFMRDDLILEDSKFVDELQRYDRNHSDTLSNTSENSLDQNAISSERARTGVDEQEVTLDVFDGEETGPGLSSLYSHLHFRHSDTLQHDGGSPQNENGPGSDHVDSDEDFDEVVNMNFSQFDSTDI